MGLTVSSDMEILPATLMPASCTVSVLPLMRWCQSCRGLPSAINLYAQVSGSHSFLQLSGVSFMQSDTLASLLP